MFHTQSLEEYFLTRIPKIQQVLAPPEKTEEEKKAAKREKRKRREARTTTKRKSQGLPPTQKKSKRKKSSSTPFVLLFPEEKEVGPSRVTTLANYRLVQSLCPNVLDGILPNALTN